MRYTCITGATSGIGKACAELFASHGHNLMLLWRREARLKTLQEDLQKSHNIQVITDNVDVRDHTQVQSFFATQKSAKNTIDILINNAWLAKWFAHIQDVLEEDIDQMIDTNIKWVLFVAKHAIPLMKQWAKHIFNVGSMSGKSAYPGWATYCGTKAAVNTISECMRLELQKDAIYVTCINPWLVNTEFQFVRTDGDQAQIDNFFKTKLANGEQLKPQDIANLIYENIGRNIAEISYRHKQ